MPDTANRDRDHHHRRRRELGREAEETPDGAELARKLYGTDLRVTDDPDSAPANGEPGLFGDAGNGDVPSGAPSPPDM